MSKKNKHPKHEEQVPSEGLPMWKRIFLVLVGLGLVFIFLQSPFFTWVQTLQRDSFKFNPEIFWLVGLIFGVIGVIWLGGKVTLTVGGKHGEE